MGFNYRKLKDSGGKLYATSLEMDFNFLTKSAGEFYIRLELLDSYDSRISIVSKIYNQNGALVAKAISSFIALFSKQNSSRNLLDYFENSESRIEEVAIY
jgi:acyl-CoA thioesterase FadM